MASPVAYSLPQEATRPLQRPTLAERLAYRTRELACRWHSRDCIGHKFAGYQCIWKDGFYHYVAVCKSCSFEVAAAVEELEDEDGEYR